MEEAKLLGKLLPTHPDILPILLEIKEKYQIPEISPTDNSIKVLLEFESEIDWESVYAEILEKVTESDLLPEKTKRAYDALKKIQSEGLKDLELEKVSEDFRKSLQTLINLFMKQYEPVISSIDGVYKELTNHCLEYLLTGEAREVPEDWFVQVGVMDSFGEKVIFAMANQAADPDKVTVMFKNKFIATFGKHRPKITEQHIKTADFLRMRWEGKSIAYLLEEEDILEPKRKKGKNTSRHSTTIRKRHDKMRQKLSRLKKTIYNLIV